MTSRENNRTKDDGLENAKKAYHSPRLSQYGTLAKLTAGGGMGSLEAAGQDKDEKKASAKP